MPDTQLTLRRESEHIYRVWLGEKRVGSITGQEVGGRSYWTWSVTAVLPNSPAYTGGSADTREEAMSGFRATFERILAGPHHWMPEPAKWTPGSGKWQG